MDAQIVSTIKSEILSLEPSMPPQAIAAKKQQLLTLFERFEALHAAAPEGKPPHEKLSAREREVFAMILDGKRLKEIGAALDISVKTVTTHRSRLMKKLGVDDNLSIYRYGIRNGLIGV